MIEVFNTLVRPAYEKLDKTLGIKHIEAKYEGKRHEIPVIIRVLGPSGVVQMSNRDFRTGKLLGLSVRSLHE